MAGAEFGGEFPAHFFGDGEEGNETGKQDPGEIDGGEDLGRGFEGDFQGAPIGIQQADGEAVLADGAEDHGGGGVTGKVEDGHNGREEVGHDIERAQPRQRGGDKADGDKDGESLAPRLIAPTSVGESWHLHFFRRISVDPQEISILAQTSLTLTPESWFSQTSEPQIVATNGAWQEVRIPLDLPDPLPSRAFARLTIEKIP